jgi:hypothetical protein
LWFITSAVRGPSPDRIQGTGRASDTYIGSLGFGVADSRCLGSGSARPVSPRKELLQALVRRRTIPGEHLRIRAVAPADLPVEGGSRAVVAAAVGELRNRRIRASAGSHGAGSAEGTRSRGCGDRAFSRCTGSDAARASVTERSLCGWDVHNPTVLLVRTSPDPVMPAGAVGLVVAAVSAVAGAASAVAQRWPVVGQVPVWAAASAASGGLLLAPGWPPAGRNTN